MLFLPELKKNRYDTCADHKHKYNSLTQVALRTGHFPLARLRNVMLASRKWLDIKCFNTEIRQKVRTSYHVRLLMIVVHDKLSQTWKSCWRSSHVQWLWPTNGPNLLGTLITRLKVTTYLQALPFWPWRLYFFNSCMSPNYRLLQCVELNKI